MILDGYLASKGLEGGASTHNKRDDELLPTDYTSEGVSAGLSSVYKHSYECILFHREHRNLQNSPRLDRLQENVRTSSQELRRSIDLLLRDSNGLFELVSKLLWILTHEGGASMERSGRLLLFIPFSYRIHVPRQLERHMDLLLPLR